MVPKKTSAGATPETSTGTVRLNKLLADNGIASRRAADRLIEQGEVMVDGEIVTELGTKVDPSVQRVEFDGVVLHARGERKRYYLLNKPTGVLCTNDPRENRRRAIDLIGDRQRGRIYTVGRLDEDTSGLVILTNDGAFAQRVGHPRYAVPKTYKAVVVGRVTEDELRKLRTGVHLAEGKMRFRSVQLRRSSDRSSTLIVTLEEGRNREVRRIFARIGHPMKTLSRVRIGRLTDRGLGVGQWRPLLRAEVTALLEGDFGETWDRPLRGAKRAPGRRPRGGARRR
jgi:23S rRNA pseudouridine2605 synthase